MIGNEVQMANYKKKHYENKSYEKIEKLRMVDVGDKAEVGRTAVAQGEIKLKTSTIEKLKTGKLEKGDSFSAGNLAGILGAKKTPELLPLCHPIPIDKISISFEINCDIIRCTCRVKAKAKTGVEMEALVGVTTALLTLWDMTKKLEKDEKGQYPTTCITNIRVIEKEKEEK
jgi:cyclic pyranopterin phosphate synthase